jgi:hypothetical protein
VWDVPTTAGTDALVETTAPSDTRTTRNLIFPGWLHDAFDMFTADVDAVTLHLNDNTIGHKFLTYT